MIFKNSLYLLDLYVTYCYIISCYLIFCSLVVYLKFINAILLKQFTYNIHYPIKPQAMPTNAVALGYNQPYIFISFLLAPRNSYV